MRSKGFIAALAASLAALGYILLSFNRALEFAASGVVGYLLAVSICLIGLISFGLILRELRFGRSMARMSRLTATQPMLAGADSTQDSADTARLEFEAAKLQVEAAPDSWQSWFRLALAYDLNRDRKRARAAMRSAERLFRSTN